MKRFHVHARVHDLAASIAFYSRLFGTEPVRVEADYAKWMLDDPRINFAISARGGAPGIDHLGFQTDDAVELAELKARATAADLALLDEGETSCCYARSDKYWVTDPQGVAWEQFHTLGDIPMFGVPRAEADAACCAAPAAVSTDAAATDAAASARGRPIAIPVKSAGSCC